MNMDTYFLQLRAHHGDFSQYHMNVNLESQMSVLLFVLDLLKMDCDHSSLVLMGSIKGIKNIQMYKISIWSCSMDG